MQEEKKSLVSHGMIWFGAAVSLAEIFTGTLLAPLGFGKGLMAILIGHAIGCVLLYLAGLIGARSGKSAMDTVKISFGNKGASFFAILNVIQLVGWTAVMIIGGARAIGAIAQSGNQTQSITLWSVVIGALIIIWVIVGTKNLNRINAVAMSALFALTVILSFIIFRETPSFIDHGFMGFGAAVELSVAMPLSWLPLISDYTRNAKNAKKTTAVSAGVYFLTSSWMYTIGLGAAIFTGQSDVAQIMLQAGMGMLGVFIILFSTVTTTFLDVFSAGVSTNSILAKANPKITAILVAILGTVLAIFTPIEQYENFLFLIGSVFAPMIAILITDFFILKVSHVRESFHITNFALWVIGFMAYRYFMSIETIVGNTVPVMLIISILCILVNGGKKYVQKRI